METGWRSPKGLDVWVNDWGSFSGHASSLVQNVCGDERTNPSCSDGCTL